MKLTERQKEQLIRKVYRALDAVQALTDAGLRGSQTEGCFSRLREIEAKVEAIEIKPARTTT